MNKSTIDSHESDHNTEAEDNQGFRRQIVQKSEVLREVCDLKTDNAQQLSKQITEFTHRMKTAPQIERQFTGWNMRLFRTKNKCFGRNACRTDLLLRAANDYGHERTVPVYCKEGSLLQCNSCDNYKRGDANSIGNKKTNVVSNPNWLQTNFNTGATTVKYDVIEEKGSSLTIDRILLYAFLSELPLHKIIELRAGFYFDKNGIIRRGNKPESEFENAEKIYNVDGTDWVALTEPILLNQQADGVSKTVDGEIYKLTSKNGKPMLNNKSCEEADIDPLCDIWNSLKKDYNDKDAFFVFKKYVGDEKWIPIGPENNIYSVLQAKNRKP